MYFFFFFLMIRRPPRSTHCISSAASDVYKRQVHTYTFSEVYDIYNQGLHLQTNSCLLTFDDGYADNFHYAFPLLKRFNIKATIFINTLYIDNDPNYLTWDQIKQMYETPCTLR
eukprot:TRINITY_DN10260_c0_g1_i4.p1 TRINITY_DN10260_c0_g1~~TRINITY_DN10260_c0_g1_i4.p1  ORF type:complete len:114 (-),score=27.20 TRINITY_DN10260_c0_g1_i4:170-511(-)